jgi:hypothetical protein
LRRGPSRMAARIAALASSTRGWVSLSSNGSVGIQCHDAKTRARRPVVNPTTGNKAFAVPGWPREKRRADGSGKNEQIVDQVRAQKRKASQSNIIAIFGPRHLLVRF